MAWIESHQELGAHPKTRKLARLLEISRPAVVGHLQFLWWWAMDYAQDGDLSRFDRLDVALGAEWDDDPDTFVTAMLAAGFLSEVDGRLVIHDWHDYAGKLIERREKDAARKRGDRRPADKPAQESPVPAPSTGRPADVQRTAHVTPPNRTEPHRTEPNHAPQPPEPVQRGRPDLTRSGSVLVATMADEIPRLAPDFEAVSPHLSATWLRDALTNAETTLRIGADELTEVDVGAALDTALDGIDRAMTRDGGPHQVASPAGLGNKLVLDAVRSRLNDARERRDRPPKPPDPRRPVVVPRLPARHIVPSGPT